MMNFVLAYPKKSNHNQRNNDDSDKMKRLGDNWGEIVKKA